MGKISGDQDEQLSEIYDRLQELKNDLAEIVDNEFDEEQEAEKTEACMMPSRCSTTQWTRSPESLISGSGKHGKAGNRIFL